VIIEIAFGEEPEEKIIENYEPKLEME